MSTYLHGAPPRLPKRLFADLMSPTQRAGTGWHQEGANTILH